MPDIKEYYALTKSLGISERLSTKLLRRNYYGKGNNSENFYSLRFSILETNKLLGLKLNRKNIEKQVKSFETQNEEVNNFGFGMDSLILAI